MAKRCPNEVRPSSACVLPLRCKRGAFHLIHRKRSPFPSRGRQRAALLQPGSKRSPHSVRRSSGRTPRTRSGLRCRYGSWSPVGTVQDRPRRQSRTALDTCHRHAAPPFLRKVPGFFRLERSESSFCQRVGAQSSLQAFCERKRRKDFGKVMA